jgi:hypothetical protein
MIFSAEDKFIIKNLLKPMKIKGPKNQRSEIFKKTIGVIPYKEKNMVNTDQKT